jgi:DNA replication and repair protein RecF
MLADLQLRKFRCFESLRVELSPGFNFFVGQNGQGKTSILEAACVLLRLQSQRSSTLLPIIRFGEKSFAVSGRHESHLLEFRYTPLRRKISFDQVEQRTPDEYLRIARVVSFANTDIELVRGSSDARRRYLDFLATQIDPLYRPTLRAYERALRSRNALLKSPHPRPRELAAYDPPLLEHGAKLSAMRARLAERLAPLASAAHREISGTDERLQLEFLPGNSADFGRDLVESRPQELRLRQTVVGPHRDDLQILVETRAANQYASEGQQRTVALALKIAQSRIFAIEEARPPLLLIDEAQKLVTATSMQWREEGCDGPVFELHDRALIRR